MVLPTHIVSVAGLVSNEKGQVLMVKSERRGWEFPGGIVENGESLPQALIREIQEESGITAKVKALVGMYSNTSKRPGYNGVKEITTIVNIDFICDYVSGEPTANDETIDAQWVDRDQALQMVTYRKNMDRLYNMLHYDGSVHCYAFKEPFEYIEKVIL